MRGVDSHSEHHAIGGRRHLPAEHQTPFEDLLLQAAVRQGGDDRVGAYVLVAPRSPDTIGHCHTPRRPEGMHFIGRRGRPGAARGQPEQRQRPRRSVHRTVVMIELVVTVTGIGSGACAIEIESDSDSETFPPKWRPSAARRASAVPVPVPSICIEPLGLSMAPEMVWLNADSTFRARTPLTVSSPLIDQLVIRRVVAPARTPSPDPSTCVVSVHRSPTRARFLTFGSSARRIDVAAAPRGPSVTIPDRTPSGPTQPVTAIPRALSNAACVIGAPATESSWIESITSLTLRPPAESLPVSVTNELVTTCVTCSPWPKAERSATEWLVSTTLKRWVVGGKAKATAPTASAAVAKRARACM